MSAPDVTTIFNSLTDKQHKALLLAAEGLTSKQIARKLAISHHSVDKRIDAVRLQLNGIRRNTLVEAYRQWRLGCHPITGGSLPLISEAESTQRLAQHPAGQSLAFSETATITTRIACKRNTRWVRPGIIPLDLSAGWRLMLIPVGAFLIAAAFVLVAAGGNVLIDLLR